MTFVTWMCKLTTMSMTELRKGYFSIVSIREQGKNLPKNRQNQLVNPENPWVNGPHLSIYNQAIKPNIFLFQTFSFCAKTFPNLFWQKFRDNN
jgi:hypothetical protein